MTVARTSCDELLRSAIARIQYEYDLVAAEATYHSDFYESVLLNVILLLKRWKKCLDLLEIMVVVNFQYKNWKIFVKNHLSELTEQLSQN